jgi:hypothetical protein
MTGFRALLDELEAAARHGEPLHDAVARVLTLGGRQPFDEGALGLTHWQREALAVAGSLPLDASRAHSTDGETWLVGVHEHGRIVFGTAGPATPHRVFGTVHVDAETAAEVRRRTAERQASEAELDRQVEAWLASIDEAEARRALAEVRFAIDHVDPVLLYVRDSTFTNLSNANNVLHPQKHDPRQYIFDAMAATPHGAWGEDERTLVACFHWALRAGGRGEEFNGRQLTPATLAAELRARIAAMSALLGEEAPDSASIAELASIARGLRERVQQTHFAWRRINGLTFRKAIEWHPRRGMTPRMEDVPAALVAAAAALGVDAGALTAVDDFMRAWTNAAIDRDGEEGLSALLETITMSAIEELRSDIGMTRGIRDLATWQRAMEAGDVATASAWPTSDYYCAVFPSAATFARFADDRPTLLRILNAISRRMEYNSWHYMPGHFDPAVVPPGRHFFFPPRMSDITVWGDMHHPGHVLARVRYSIRAPAPVVHGDRKFYGMTDLRLMRMGGAPYTVAELMRARTYAAYLRGASQALAGRAAAGAPLVISAFRAAWFAEHFG